MAFVILLICIGIAFAGFQCTCVFQSTCDTDGGWHALDAAQ